MKCTPFRISYLVDSRLILEKTPGFSQDGLYVAALHHEKYNGSGYHDGKKVMKLV